MSDDVKKKNKHRQLEIKLEEDVAQGVYANMAVVNHTGGEFCLDMIFVQPQQPKATVRSRIITSPRSAKMLLGALAAAVESYEEEYGTVEIEPVGAVPEVDGDFH